MQAMSDVALGHFIRGEYTEALKLYKNSYVLALSLKGPKHPDTASALHNMANVLVKTGDLDQALAHLDSAATIRTSSQCLGAHHPITITTLQNMELVLQKSKPSSEFTPDQKNLSFQIRDRIRWFRTVQARLEESADSFVMEADPRIRFLLQKSRVESQKAKLNPVFTKNALKLHEELLQIYEGLEQLGPDNLVTLKLVSKMGQLEYGLGEYDKAIELYRRVYDGRLQSLGEEHPETVKSLRNQALAMAGKADGLDKSGAGAVLKQEAERLLYQVYAIQLQTAGSENRETRSTFNSLMVLQRRE